MPPKITYSRRSSRSFLIRRGLPLVCTIISGLSRRNRMPQTPRSYTEGVGTHLLWSGGSGSIFLVSTLASLMGLERIGSWDQYIVKLVGG
ncbi:hypothetical protein JB92DRAFT_2959188 [Gautieria morchelliformis]|nr:hypothetical protein JB92DRAFT_2959188 [Gautieria morchelliformis]